MNYNDIKKCIKNGGFWTSKGDIPIFISRAGFEPEAYRRALRSKQVHATKAEAKLAIATRRRDERVAKRKATPETPEQLKDGWTDEEIEKAAFKHSTNDVNVLRIWDAIMCISKKLSLSYKQVCEIESFIKEIASNAKMNHEVIVRKLGIYIPALQIGAKAMGMSIQEFKKALKEGSVASDEFLPKFSEAIIELYGDNTKEWTDIPQVVTKRNNTDDSVTHPKHYTSHPSGIECIQVTEHMNFCRGNAMKYIWRAGEKGDEIEDLKKARWYIDREITRLEKAKEQK